MICHLYVVNAITAKYKTLGLTEGHFTGEQWNVPVVKTFVHKGDLDPGTQVESNALFVDHLIRAIGRRPLTKATYAMVVEDSGVSLRRGLRSSQAHCRG